MEGYTRKIEALVDQFNRAIASNIDASSIIDQLLETLEDLNTYALKYAPEMIEQCSHMTVRVSQLIEEYRRAREVEENLYNV